MCILVEVLSNRYWLPNMCEKHLRHSSVSVVMGNYFSYKFLSKYSSENTDFSNRVVKYLRQRILSEHKEKSISLLCWSLPLTARCNLKQQRKTEAWENGMDRDGFTSQRNTAQMEKNESEECCMAEKNQSIRGMVKNEHLNKIWHHWQYHRELLMVLKEK